MIEKEAMISFTGTAAVSPACDSRDGRRWFPADCPAYPEATYTRLCHRHFEEFAAIYRHFTSCH